MFNTLMYTKQLEEVGITREQAEAHIKIMTEVMQQLYTFREEFKSELRSFKEEFKEFKVATESNFKEIQSEMRQMEYRVIMGLGSIVTVGLAAMAAIVKLL